jgi:hypothetical protein
MAQRATRSLKPVATPTVSSTLRRGLPLGAQASISALQRTVGNQAVLRMLSASRQIPIQRKVGLELEIAADLAKGTVIERNEKSRLVDDDDAGYKPLKAAVTKGESITSGTGWDLTPDGSANDWYPEFITKAYDEVTEPAGIVTAVTAVKSYAEQTLGPLGRGMYQQLPKNYVIGWRPQSKVSLNANIHVTGGVRRDRVYELLRQLSAKKQGLRPTKQTRGLLKTAVQAAPSGDPIYQGLVALLGGYIAGQRQLSVAQAEQIKYSLGDYDLYNDEQYSGMLYRLDKSVSEADIAQFIREGTVTSDGLARAKTQYNSGQQLYEELGRYVKGYAPSAAKIQVPVLSRTSLKEMVSKVNAMPVFGTFLQDVLAAAGGLDGAKPLFPLGLEGPGTAGRTVETNPNITIQAWVKTVHEGQNLTWSENVFKVEDVGPILGTTCCFFVDRAEGVVVEIRDTGDRMRPSQWVTIATEMRDLFTALNDANT